MDEQIQCIPSQDPIFTKSDRRCLFTRLHSSWSQCNYKIVQHATFWKKQKSSGFAASSCCWQFFFLYDLFLTLNSCGYHHFNMEKTKQIIKNHTEHQDFCCCLKRLLERRESEIQSWKHQNITVIKLIISRVSVEEPVKGYSNHHCLKPTYIVLRCSLLSVITKRQMHIFSYLSNSLSCLGHNESSPLLLPWWKP